jgi:hypothetical protein
MSRASGLFKKCFRKNPSVVSRPVGNEIVIVPTEGKGHDLEKIYTISGCGTRLWNLLDGRSSLDTIKKEMLKEFDVPGDTLEKDIEKIIGKLIQSKLIGLVEKNTVSQEGR